MKHLTINKALIIGILQSNPRFDLKKEHDGFVNMQVGTYREVAGRNEGDPVAYAETVHRVSCRGKSMIETCRHLKAGDLVLCCGETSKRAIKTSGGEGVVTEIWINEIRKVNP